MLLMYQIKVGLCLIAFYLLWKLLLSRETFHRFNRVALLTVMALALVLPWIKLTVDAPAALASNMIVLEDILVTPDGAAQVQQTASRWTPMDIITVVYYLGMAAALLWFLHGRWNLYRMMKKGRKEMLPSGNTLHVLPGDQSPFSYFNHIVINEQDYRDNPREILTHEEAHISLHHSLDVLFSGLVTMFQWWNPAAWLLTQELRQVHEYEADEAVLKQGIDARQYQLLLIKKSVGNQLFAMANNLNYQSLKKRIRMMTMNKSSRWSRLRALAVVPVIALALLAFANQKSNAAVTASAAQAETVKSSTQLPVAVQAEAAPVTVEKTVEEPAPAEPVKKEEVYKSVEQMPQFPGGDAALMKYLMMNIKYPANAAKNDIEGRVIVQFVVEKDGQIGEVKVARSVDEELDAEAVRVVKALPKFTPGRQDGKAVAVWYTLPISFKLQSKPQPQEPQPEQQ